MEETENKNRENLSQESPVQESAAAETATSESTAQKTKKPLKFKLGENIKKFALMILSVFQDYPVTMIAILLAAFGSTILVTWDNRDTIIYPERVIAFLTITAMQTIAFEEVFAKKKLVRYVGCGVSAILSVIYVWFLTFQGETLFGMDPDIPIELVAKILFVHGIITLGLSIWHMYRRTEEDFEVYATKAFLELLKASVVYGLFALGLALLIWVFNELIFDTDEFMAQVEIFLAGGIYVPMCLKALSSKNETPGKFSRFCILYVLQSMQLLAFAIIYLYIIKLFVTREDTSNKIFLILGCLFAVGMPIWTMIHGLEHKDGFLGKIAPFIPYAFIPFVFLQIWSISLRISAYGMTIDRYGCVVLVVCEIIYFVLYFLRHRGNKQAVSYSLFVLMVAAFICILCPGTNYESVVIRSQMKRMAVMLEEENPSELTKSDIKSAYRVIQHIGPKGKKALEDKLTEDQIAKINTYDINGSLRNAFVYLSAYRNFSAVDVTEYCAIYEFSAFSTTYSDGRMTITIQKDDRNSETEIMKIDIGDYVSGIMDTYTESYDSKFSIRGMGVISLNDWQDLYLTQINIEFNKETKKVNTISLEGYLLLKRSLLFESSK